MGKFKIKLRSIVIGAVVGIVAGAALIMSAYAFNDEDAGDSVRSVEVLDGNGSYITAQAAGLADLDTETDVTLSPYAGVTDEDAEYSDGELTRRVESIGEEKDYLSEMTPEELLVLSAEALDNEGLDTSLADGELVTYGITFDIPEGFTESESQSDMYVTGRFPIDVSNIVYSECEADYTLQLMDEAYFEQLVEEGFLNQYGETTDVSISEYRQYSIDGVPAVRVKAEYDIDEQHVTHLMIAVNGSKTYTLVYTQTQDYDHMEEFEASVGSIGVRK